MPYIFTDYEHAHSKPVLKNKEIACLTLSWLLEISCTSQLT